MILLAFVTMALAQDTRFVPDGVTTTAIGPSFIVPETRMDELIARATALDGVLIASRKCVDAAAPALGESREAIRVCTSRMDTDAGLIRDQQADAAKSSVKMSRLKQQRNVAVVLTVGVLAGAVTVMTLSR